MKLKSKLPRVGTTIFSVMSALATEQGAINLSQGFPDFDVDPGLIDCVAHHMRAGHNQYPPMQGIALLRERLAAKTLELQGARYDADSEITVTAGGTEAVFSAISAVVHRGDEVIILEPAYDAYGPIVELNGGVPVYCSLTYPDYAVDWDAVGRAVSERTRMIVLNSPHNPTGAVLSADDMTALMALTRGTDILILSDEVYEHIIFDGRRHESVSRYPELARRSFVVGSFGKTYHATGWKTGYCLAPAALTTELRRVHQYVVFAANAPIQHAYADFMADPRTYLGVADFYQRKRDLFLDLMQGSRFRALPCRGTYFAMFDYSAVSDEPDVDFARRLTVEHKVAAIPPSVFYDGGDDHRVLRFCFAKNDQTLQEAAQRLCRI